MSPKQDIILTPYLHFSGNCEEALQTYQKIIGGSFEIENRYDNPNMDAPEDYKDKVLHARYSLNGLLFMACDVFPGQTAASTSGSVALSLELSELENAKKVFADFAQESDVHVQFEKQFWGDWHGNLTDKFGIRWMVNFMVN